MLTDVDVVISVILSMKGHARILLKQKRWFAKLKARDEHFMKTKRYYYYASERGCMKAPDSVDELGVGVEEAEKSCSLHIRLIRLREDFDRPRFTVEVSAHIDQWRVFVECRDVFELLATRTARSGETRDSEPFYALRIHLEQLGYKNLGVLVH